MTATDAANNRPEPEVVDEAEAPVGAVSSPLDGRIDFGRLGWFGVTAAIVFLAAIGLRFTQLDTYVMTQREGEWAYDAWS
ncbi:MAG: hypothetical protein H0T93_09620, partial [Chloroflexia bacterium]|nr:hypothetical protein [Chloroflexia bacterium]